jgi:hypothetical protein
MDATPHLSALAAALRKHGLEAILIGNSAAALQGAPVTTLDFDFLFRKTPLNIRKLKAVARSLGATIMKPYYPVSSMFRLEREDDGLQVDFVTRMSGVNSLESLRSRSHRMEFDGAPLIVADLRDIIKSKRTANRPRDKAVLDVLERTLRAKAKTIEEESS